MIGRRGILRALGAGPLAATLPDVLSAAPLSKVKSRGSLVVGLYKDMPPFHADGAGIDVELGRVVPRLEWVVGHLFVGRRVAFSLPPDLFGGALQIAAELGLAASIGLATRSAPQPKSPGAPSRSSSCGRSSTRPTTREVAISHSRSRGGSTAWR